MEPDHVDTILYQWSQERSEIDVSGMAIIGRISRLEKEIQRHLDEVFQQHDLESWEFDVLATLLRSGEPYQLTPGQLLQSMMITSGAMTNRIDRLERRGFVQRAKNSDDHRQVLVTLTRNGAEKADTVLTDHAANELTLISSLDSTQREQLVELLRILQVGVSSRS